MKVGYVECCGFGEIVDDEDCVGGVVVRADQWSECLLPYDMIYNYVPAVSQICILTSFPSILIRLNLKSTPMVANKLSWNSSSTNRASMDDLPTEESPTNTNLN